MEPHAYTADAGRPADGRCIICYHGLTEVPGEHVDTSTLPYGDTDHGHTIGNGMTRKHYVALAAELRRQDPRPNAEHFDYPTANAWERGAYDEWSTIVIGIADVLAADNPRFDRQRFYAAAGMVRP